MSLAETLRNLNLPADAVAKLSYKEGVDVFVHNETDTEDGLRETDTAEHLAVTLSDSRVANCLQVFALRSNEGHEDFPRE